MTKFDFFHIIGYGRTARKNGDPKAHVAGIVAEAERKQHASRHVRSPLKPIRIFGCSPSEAAAEAIVQADHARDSIGRGVRRDGIVLFAAVASYPVLTNSVAIRQNGGIKLIDPNFLAWQKKALAWALKRFGSALRSVVLHLDEEYPHVHFFIVPPLVDGRLRHDLIHPGRAAIREIREIAEAEAQAAKKAVAPVLEVSVKDRKRAERLAYRKAMSAFLDDYHGDVGESFGHERHGPGRRRRARTVQLEVRRVERERDEAIALAKRQFQQRFLQLRKDDEERAMARDAESTERLLNAMRYRETIDAELAAERQRGDHFEAALAEALAILEAHGLSAQTLRP